MGRHVSDELSYALGDMDRRLGNIVRQGTVVGLDFSAPAAPRVRVDVGELTTDWLPWLAPRAGRTRVWNPPSMGEQVAVLSAGEPSIGIVLPGGIFQDAIPANGGDAKDTRVTFQDGSVVEFDDVAGALNVQVNPAGSIRLNIGRTTLLLQDGQATLTTPMWLVDSPQSTFTGKVTVQGLLTYQAGMAGSGGAGAAATIQGGVAVTGGDVSADGIGLKTHHHTDPQGGSVGAPTP
jgi:phage baseplate assembly protein V